MRKKGKRSWNRKLLRERFLLRVNEGGRERKKGD